VYPLKFVFALVFSPLTGSDIAHGVGWHEAGVLMRIYAAGFTAVFCLFALMYVHAYKLRIALGLNPVEILEAQVAIQKNVLMALVGAGSFGLAFLNPEWAGWWYFVLGPALGVHGAIYGKRVRLLAQKLGLS
jgi:hypothetical protein